MTLDEFNTVLLWAEHHSVVLVLAVFCVIVVTTYWPGRKRQIEDHGFIPLQDDR